MKPRRWIIVDERVSRETSRRGINARYYSLGGWEFFAADATKFDSWDEALAHVNSARDAGMSVAIVPLVSVRTMRARAVEAATMRAELEGLRATDEEMAARLAAVTSERDALRRELDEVRAGVARALDRGKATAATPYS